MESIKALVVPLVIFEIKTTTNAKIKIGKNAETYDINILERLSAVPFTNNDATTDKSITKIRFAIIKLAIARIFPVKTLSLEAGTVRVNLIVCSTNSLPNISMQTKAVKRGKKE